MVVGILLVVLLLVLGGAAVAGRTPSSSDRDFGAGPAFRR